MRGRVGKIARITAWAAASLLGMAVVAGAGSLVWLRTDAGERTVAGFVKRTLAGRGIFLSMDAFEGPLPLRLHFVNARLADAGGVWFAAKDVEIRLDAGGLLDKTAVVTFARVDTPEVYRLPDLPASPPEPAAASSAREPPGAFSLPVGVRLDALAVENLGVYSPVVFPGAVHAGDAPPLFRVSVHGAARADAAKPLEHSTIDARATIEAAVADTEQLGAALRSGQLPFDAATVTAEVRARFDETLKGAITGAAAVSALNGETHTIDYGLESKIGAGVALLPKAFIEGLGLRLDVSGEYALDEHSARVAAKFFARDGGQWRVPLGRLAGRDLGGALQADMDAALAANGDVSARLALSGTHMRWGEGRIPALLAKAVVSGTVRDPALTLAFTGDEIATPAGTFRDARVAVDARAAFKPGGGASLRSSGTLSLGESPAGPMRFTTLLEAERSAAGDLAARVHGVDLALAGVELTADVAAAIPAGAKAFPSLTGTASAAIADWKPLAALAGIPLSGEKAGFSSRFMHGGNGQEVVASWHAGSLSLPGVFSVTGVSGTLEAANLPDGPTVALAATLGKGEAGLVDWESGALSVNTRHGAGPFAIALRADKTAPRALSALAGQKGSGGEPARGERLSVSGEYAFSPMRVSLNRFAARLPGSPAGVFLAAPAVVALDGGVRVRGLTLKVTPGGGSLACDASLTEEKTDIAVAASGVPFRLVRELTGAALPDGTADLSVVLKKNGAAISGKIDAKAAIASLPAPGKKQGGPDAVFTLSGALDRGRDPAFPALGSARGLVRLKGSARFGIGTAPAETGEPQAVFNFPLRFGADGVPVPDRTAPLGARLNWRGDIGPLWALAAMPDRTLTGMGQVTASLKGTLAKPDYAVTAYFADGRFKDDVLGILLTGVTMEAAASSAGENRLVLRAEDVRGGYVSLEGRLLPPGGATGEGVPRLAARGHANHMEPLHRDDLFLRFSGRIAVDGPVNAMRIAADMELERAEVSLLANLGGGVRTLEIADAGAKPASAPTGHSCDIKVKAPGRFFIRGRGLDSEWEGDLAVKGPVSLPSLTGSLRPVRGYFDLLSRPFAFDKGDISFFGGDRVNPALNLSLTHAGPNITAIVLAGGTAKKPELVMESRPPLPQDQIMAEVLFGKEFSRLSRFEALQVANGVRQLANIGEGGLDPLAAMRTSLGLDMLRIGSSGSESSGGRSVSGAPGADAVDGSGRRSRQSETDAATPAVEAGKYINDAVYVGVEQGATADSTGVRVEVELLPNLTLQGKSSARSSEIGLGWKKDY